MKLMLAAVAAFGAVLAAAPADAREAAFNANLRGDTAPTDTDSPATGSARIVVDLDAKTVDLSLIVTGITVSELWDPLVAQPMGPIHLHLYAAGDTTTAVTPRSSCPCRSVTTTKPTTPASP